MLSMVGLTETGFENELLLVTTRWPHVDGKICTVQLAATTTPWVMAAERVDTGIL